METREGSGCRQRWCLSWGWDSVLTGPETAFQKLSGCWLTSQEAGNLFLILGVHIHRDVSPGSLYGKVL